MKHRTKCAVVSCESYKENNVSEAVANFAKKIKRRQRSWHSRLCMNANGLTP
jgi:hypothetical protein